MNKLLSGILPLLVACSAFAMDAKDPPIPTEPNIVGIVIFGVLFVGSCVGFFVYLWWADRDKGGKKGPKA